MMELNIAVLPGDGIGPEVMTVALNVVNKALESFDKCLRINEAQIGGIAIDTYGTALPEETLKICKESDAVFLGSIGGPKWDHLSTEERPEVGGLLKLRKELDLYANIRPTILYDGLNTFSPLASRILNKGLDFVTVRELSSGIYFGQPKKISDVKASDTMVYTREEIERIAIKAFEIARNRRKKVTSVDKANVLSSSVLWRRVVNEVSQNYKDVKLEHLYVDNAAMQLILKPSQFDVILTSNLFGDILSDESAAISGSLGLLPSASLGTKVHLYEAAGGSAPDIAGLGIANPIAQILSGALMLDYSFGLKEISINIFEAVKEVLSDGYRTVDIATLEEKAISTELMGELICRKL